MNYERAESRLLHLSSAMMGAADRSDWEQVADLHRSLQEQLQTLFSGTELPADQRPAQLLMEIQRTSESLSNRASAEQSALGAQLDQSRHRRRGMSMYQESVNVGG